MSTAILGVLFLVVGFTAMFLMYKLWGYPFDKATHTSAAPRWAMALHRGLGYVFVAIYLVLMWHMVPRLWEYQVEFPARTAMHIVLGFTIGFLLLVKIAIMRFFRHFEEWMPYLGTAIMLGTVLLLGLSLPFVFQERALARKAPGGDVLSPASQARVAQLLPAAKLPPDAVPAELASRDGLATGRTVLLDKCVACHDVKTILARPRSPENWWDTVSRMADKPALFAPMTTLEQYQVTAYLIAITPDLQRAAKRKRDEQTARLAAVGAPAVAPPSGGPAVDLVVARRVYTEQCGQCHDLSDVDARPPKTHAESRALVERMITENDATLSAEQVEQITAYLNARFVDNTAQ